MVTSGLSDGCDANRGRRWQSETDTLNQFREVEASSIDDGMDFNIVVHGNWEKYCVTIISNQKSFSENISFFRFVFLPSKLMHK